MESNTSILPQECSSKIINHLGLVAGMYDELGLGELIDSLIPQDKEKRVVSVGQSVKEWVFNNMPLLKPVSPFFCGKRVLKRARYFVLIPKSDIFYHAPILYTSKKRDLCF